MQKRLIAQVGTKWELFLFRAARDGLVEYKSQVGESFTIPSPTMANSFGFARSNAAMKVQKHRDIRQMSQRVI